MIHSAGNSSKYFKVLQYYGEKYKLQTSSIGRKFANNKRIKFNKTELNRDELNTMVKRAVTSALKKKINADIVLRWRIILK